MTGSKDFGIRDLFDVADTVYCEVRVAFDWKSPSVVSHIAHCANVSCIFEWRIYCLVDSEVAKRHGFGEWNPLSLDADLICQIHTDADLSHDEMQVDLVTWS